jgi:hypothetical protein
MSRRDPNSKRIRNVRQAILDFVAANPDVLSSDLQAHMPGYRQLTLSRYLREMHESGDLIRKTDVTLTGTPYRYKAIRAKASPAPKTWANMSDDDYEPPKPKEPKPKLPPGVYRNECGQHEFKSQGGQGAIQTRRAGFSSCMVNA